MKKQFTLLLTAFVSSFFIHHSAFAFEGRITATLTRGGQATPLLYTAGTNFLRVEVTASDRPNPVNIIDRSSGALLLLFPHNRSFVRLKPAADNAAMPPGLPHTPGGDPQSPPPGDPQSPPPGAPLTPNGHSPGIGPTNLPGLPAMPTPPAAGRMPALPMMPMPGEAFELQATGEHTNLLGLACARYELKQRGEILQVWATEQLLPFQTYLRNQPPRFGPRMVDEQWGAWLTAKKLFPLSAVVRFENGSEHFRFEVQTVTPQPLPEADMLLFQPPADYYELEPLPF